MQIRQSAVDRTAGFETFVGYVYLDTNGYVTVGYGRMLPDADSATAIPFKLNGSDATSDAKRQEWTTMNSQEAGHVASYYKQFTQLTLAQSDALSILTDDLTTAAGNLATRFPSLDDYPDPAQDALLDMMFNIGVTKFTKNKWPSLFAAVESKDWTTAAAESHRPDVPDGRNNAIRDLFLSAAAVVFQPAIALNMQQMFEKYMSEILHFIESGEKHSKFYPSGITELKVSLKVATVGLELEIRGPDRSEIRRLPAATTRK
jgi:GH24 family phage-related lysozyme (muramidase)